MRLLGPASLGSFSWLVLARRCWLRFWGGFARLGLSGRCWLRLSSGCAEPWLSRRCWRSVLAAFAVAFASFLAMHSSSVLATAADLWRLSFFRPLRCLPSLPAQDSCGICPLLIHYSTAPATCPCFGRGVSLGVWPFPVHLSAAPVAYPCFGCGPLSGSVLFLTFSWLLAPVPASGADISRGLTFPVHHLAAQTACPCLGCGVSHGAGSFPSLHLATPAACPCFGRGSLAGPDFLTIA